MSGIDGDRKEQSYDVFSSANRFLDGLHKAILGEDPDLGEPMAQPPAGKKIFWQIEEEHIDEGVPEWETAPKEFIVPSVTPPSFGDVYENLSEDEIGTDSSTPIATTPDDSPKGSLVYHAAVDQFLKRLSAVPDGQPFIDEFGQTALSAAEVKQIKEFIEAKKYTLYALKPINLLELKQKLEVIVKNYADHKISWSQAQDQILQLTQPYTLRFSYKTEQGLPRTLDFTFDHNGNFIGVVHTNKKIIDTTDVLATRVIKSSKAELGKGAYKVAKTSHGVFEAVLSTVARLQADIQNPTEMLNLVKEMIFAQTHRGSQYVDSPIMGSIYKHTKPGGLPTIGCYVYSKRALCSMHHLEKVDDKGQLKFLTPAEYAQIKAERKAGKIPEIYLQLFKDALHGLAEIHAKGQIHRDIKPDNIFVYRDEHGKLHAKVSDPGIAALKHENLVPLASFTYATPQAIQENRTGEYRKYFYNDHGQDLCIAKLDCKIDAVEPKYYADPADDIYALGVAMLEKMLNVKTFMPDSDDNRKKLQGYLAKFSKEYPEFAKMLAREREDRPTAIQSIEQMQRVTKLAM